MAGRPPGAQNKDKPFRDALRLELAALDEEDPKTLRRLARRLLETAAKDDGLQAIKEVADRLDGKPAQALIGGDEDDPAIQAIHTIRRIIVDPRHPDGESVPPASQAGEV